jgi:hypothetical protein
MDELILSYTIWVSLQLLRYVEYTVTCLLYFLGSDFVKLSKGIFDENGSTRNATSQERLRFN